MSIAGVGAAATNPYLDSLLQSSQTSQTSGIAALLAAVDSSATTASSSATGASSAGSDSVSISSPSKLFSQLQLLEKQDPAKFKEVTADIASKLQTASTQATGGVSNFLSSLASKFETASTTGDASGLQPTHHGHHHPHGTYNAQGQVAPQAPPDVNSSNASGGTDLKALFAAISQEVSQAVAA